MGKISHFNFTPILTEVVVKLCCSLFSTYSMLLQMDSVILKQHNHYYVNSVCALTFCIQPFVCTQV